MVGTHHRIARRARRDARKAGAAHAMKGAKGLFAAASAERKKLSRARRAAAKVAKQAAAAARKRIAAARKLSKARRAAKAGARKRAAAGKKALRAARGLKLKRFSAKHKDHVKAVGRKSEVYKGLAKHTSGGLTKKDIVRKTIRRGGKVVYRYMSKKRAMAGKRRGLNPALKAWRSALRRVGAKGIPKKGTAMYKAAKVEYAKILRKSAPVGGKKRTASKRRASL